MTDTKDWTDAERPDTALLQQADSLETLRQIVSDLGARFGFRFYKVYQAPIPDSVALRSLLLLTNLPDEFLEDFDRIGYSSEALSRMRLIEQAQLTQWTLAELLEREDPAKGRKLTSLLQRQGISHGVYVNIAPVDGPMRILSFFGNQECLTTIEAEQLTVMSVQLLHRINRVEKRRSWDNAGLTSLEMECLLLASQGHEANDIGRRLGLSGRTVLYLASSICSKLDVGNLEQAVAEAIRCGFIG